MTFPSKLKKGDQIRVVSPALSLAVVSPEVRQEAIATWESLGLKVTFGENVKENDILSSSSVASRVTDLHAAFADPEVKAVIAAIGGYSGNQLLRYIDYDLIRSHPKILCGYSDITALASAIHAKTGLVTYSGPNFSTLGMRQGIEYTRDYFKSCLMQADPFSILPSQKWSDDDWFKDQDRRTFENNLGFLVINEGEAEGTLLGGNLCTLNLLQGTEYMPSLSGTIVLLEDDEESHARMFDRDLQSLLHLPGADEIRGLVIGRFQKVSKVSSEELVYLVRAKKELARIPVIANADFGHTTPQFTFPIGGHGKLSVEKDNVQFTISQH